MTFSTITIGKKIASLRKAKNMTQMELADAMGVSYQAVSNWERGNSMPDISKLPELTVILGCSIDELLSDEEGKNLIKHVVEGDAERYIQENKVSIQTIGEVAPVLRPTQTERLMDCILEENEEHLTLRDLISVAPFVGAEYLERFVDRVDVVEGIGPLCGLAPFLSEEALDKLVRRVQDTGSLQQLTGLAPFLKEETLDRLVTKAMEQGNISECKGLYPFLGRDTLHKLADILVKQGGFATIRDLAPFL